MQKMKRGVDWAVVSAEVGAAASSGVNPFPSSEGVQDVKLRLSVRVQDPQDPQELQVRFSPGGTEQSLSKKF